MAKEIIDGLLSPVIVALVGYVVWLLQETRKEQRESQKARSACEQNMSRAMKYLLGLQIDIYHRRHCIKGEPMTADDYTEIQECWECYSSLDGNGVREKEYRELAALDISG